MFIEDIIAISTNDCRNQIKSLLTSKELEILDSFYSYQCTRNESLTEKQGMLALRLITQCKEGLKNRIPDIDSMLDSPKWRNEFRVIAFDRSIKIEELAESKKKIINVRFAYDSNLVNKFRKRNQTVHSHYRGTWDSDKKCWSFNLTEKNVLFLGDSLLAAGDFFADKEFQNLYQQASNIRYSIEEHIPMLVFNDGKYEIVNASSRIPQPNTNSLVKALFHARKYGITLWSDEIDLEISKNLNNVTKAIIKNNSDRYIWFISIHNKIEDFSDLLQNSDTIAIIVPGGEEYKLTKEWVELALQCGIDKKHISVMFRLPNDQAKFNKYVKDSELNNPVNENTRIVFINTKVTKPIAKADLKFDTVINLGHYQNMHFTITTLSQNVCNLIYYNMKEPAVLTWQPQRL